MALRRICDRCGATVPEPITLEKTTRTVVIPQADPSTRPVESDVSVNVGIGSDHDLCAVCLASAIVEYALNRAGSDLPPRVFAALGERIATAIARVKP